MSYRNVFQIILIPVGAVPPDMNRSYYAQAVTGDDPSAHRATLGGLALALLVAVALFLALVTVSYPVVAGLALLALGSVAVTLAGRR